MIILIAIGGILLLKNLILEPIAYSSFYYPVLYIATGALGLSYLKYKDDTYATIFKILIWIEIILNVLGLIVLFLFTFIFAAVTSAGGCNAEGKYCVIGEDGLENCNQTTDCETTQSAFGLATIILAISFLIYLAVTILMCVTLSHFKKYEDERKSHHYSGI